jgi:hypothetical protein
LTVRRRALLVAGVTIVVLVAAVGLGSPSPTPGVPPLNNPARPGGPVTAPSVDTAAGNPAANGGPHVATMHASKSNVDVRRLPRASDEDEHDGDAEEGEEGDERENPVPAFGGSSSLAAIGTGESPQSAPAPNPATSFEGLANTTDCNGTPCGAGHPPDTNGDVGPTYYIQTINTAIGIFNKSTGSQVAAFTFDALMHQGAFGNLCDTDNFGDPVVLYDTFADRWIITDFAFKVDGSGNVVSPPGAFQCFAVSQSGDPVSGGWYFYSLQMTDALGDYPKLGIWPDGIYMSANMFGFPAGGAFQNVRVWALDKAQMYAGQAAQSVSFDVARVQGQSPFTLLPSNARAQTGTPPAGRPNLFTGILDFNALRVWKFHVDWANTSNSTFTGPSTSQTGSSWSLPPSSVPSKNGNNLDTLSYRLMAQNQYTNIGGVESLWDAHSVAGASGTQSAVRWYQVPVTGGTVGASAIQAGTYNPDTDNRFMPSVAANRNGDMAIGYTVASASTYPAIRYAGRLAGDAAGTITLTEASLINGTGTQVGSCGGAACIRWGDYSAMTLDPDGCTFWYTSEYYPVSGLNHHTRIGSFRFAGCTDAPPPTQTPIPPSPSPTVAATPTSSPPPTATPGRPTASPVVTAPPDQAVPTITTPGLSPNPVIPGASVTVTAVATDNLIVASAEKQLNGGSWTAMSAVDGAFGEASEAVTSTITAPATAGTYQVCVRARDASNNTSNGLACTTLTVMSFSLAPATASATAAQGKSAAWTINITRSSFPGSIAFAATGLPAGTNATFVANPSTAGSTVLTITTSNCTTPTPRGTFTITVNGSSGGLTRSTTVKLTVTNSVPTLTAPAPTLYGNTTVTSTTVRVKERWSACDADGLTSYRLQRQVNGGSWSTVSLSTALTTSINQSLTKGKTYRYRVRATDRSGLVSTYSYGPTFKPIVSDQTSSLISYTGTWSTATSSSYFGGSARYSTSPGASATYRITASGAAWIAYKSSTRGTAQVFVDGVLKATITLKASTTTARAQVYAINWGANGTHTVKVVVVSGRVDIDAFVRLVRV